jgi:hypothetical protein
MSGKKAARLAGSISKSTQTASIFDLFFAKKHLAVKWHFAASKTRRNQTKRQKHDLIARNPIRKPENPHLRIIIINQLKQTISGFAMMK